LTRESKIAHLMTLNPNLKCNAEEVAQAVCESCEIDEKELVYGPKCNKLNFARGLYCAVTALAGIHPKKAAQVIKRSRAHVITSAKHYIGYLEVGDPVITKLYEKILRCLRKDDEHAYQAVN